MLSLFSRKKGSGANLKPAPKPAPKNNYKIEVKGTDRYGWRTEKWTPWYGENAYSLNTYDKNGVLRRSVEYKNDEKHGPCSVYDSYGQLIQKGWYRHGEKDGEWQEIDVNRGFVSEICTYKNGKKDGLYERYTKNTYYQEAPQLVERCSYKEDEPAGVCEVYWENGNPLKKCTYKDGKLEGAYEEYYRSGRLRCRYHYKDGVPHGSFETYNPKGVLKEKNVYINGEKVSPNTAEFQKYFSNEGGKSMAEKQKEEILEKILKHKQDVIEMLSSAHNRKERRQMAKYIAPKLCAKSKNKVLRMWEEKQKKTK